MGPSEAELFTYDGLVWNDFLQYGEENGRGPSHAGGPHYVTAGLANRPGKLFSKDQTRSRYAPKQH